MEKSDRSGEIMGRWWQTRWIRKSGLFVKPGQKSIEDFLISKQSEGEKK